MIQVMLSLLQRQLSIKGIIDAMQEKKVVESGQSRWSSTTVLVK